MACSYKVQNYWMIILIIVLIDNHVGQHSQTQIQSTISFQI
jgi:hypothetical protein